MQEQLKVHSIESFGTHEGPGIRMVIFLQGCNIKCLYCQNADTIPNEGGQLIDVDELVTKAVNLKGYFGKKGGLTVSGGEPLLQSKALISLFLKLQEQGIHCNIDTNGTIINSHSEKLISEISDLVMFDVKHSNEKGFERMVGKNLHQQSFALMQLREKSNKPFWIRYVLVPGYTDTEEDLVEIGKILGSYKNLDRFQVLPYHKLGAHKWTVMGESYPLQDLAENTPEQIEKAKHILEKYFKTVVI